MKLGNWNVDTDNGLTYSLDIRAITEKMLVLEEAAFRKAVVTKLRELGYTVTEPDVGADNDQ